MKPRSFGLAVTVAVIGFSLAACGCFQQKMRGEAAPPAAPEQKTVVAPEQKERIVGGARSERNVVTGSWNGRDSFFNLRDGVGKCALLACRIGSKGFDKPGYPVVLFSTVLSIRRADMNEKHP